ncbi:hypothetical protein DA093_07495 [Vibrio rotiferianus]|nr:hypothetical protein DA093_07495 [Vibrio rotiferianus]
MQTVLRCLLAHSEKREARSEKREARSEKREARTILEGWRVCVNPFCFLGFGSFYLSKDKFYLNVLH